MSKLPLPATNLETEILRFRDQGEISHLNLKIDQMIIVNDLKQCLSEHLNLDDEKIEILMSKIMIQYQLDTGIEINYLSQALPQERIVHVGKMLYRVQNYLKEKIADNQEFSRIEEIFDTWFQNLHY